MRDDPCRRADDKTRNRNKRDLKLNERRVWLARRLTELGVLPESLAAGLGVSKKYLKEVLRGKYWADDDE